MDPSSTAPPPLLNPTPTTYPKSGALSLEVLGVDGKARASVLTLPHHTVKTPVFMPVGTQGTIKGLTKQEVEEIGCEIILSNTYHLGHRPGPDVVDKMGGLHKFMDWDRNILTDSGGFQMVSLCKLMEKSEEGVLFQSPHDKSEMLMTPEHSMFIQNKIGADIMMAMDDVVSSKITGKPIEDAMHRSIRWLDRCIYAHQRPHDQNLFAIIQGGLVPELREYCLEEMIKRDTPGYAIGGLSGGESKHDFWKVVTQCTDKLPKNKPRYLMGVGYAEDLVVCTALGVDMFDCVFPTRTARFGSALMDSGSLQVKKDIFKDSLEPLDRECSCMVCKTYTRSYLHLLMTTKEPLGCALMTYHNISYQMRLMRRMREAILDKKLQQFIQTYMITRFPKEEKLPQWVRDALASQKIYVTYEKPSAGLGEGAKEEGEGEEGKGKEGEPPKKRAKTEEE